MHEQLNKRNPLIPYDLRYTDTALMSADIYTKGFSDADKWEHAQKLINVFKPGKLQGGIEDHTTHYGRVGKIPKPESADAQPRDAEVVTPSVPNNSIDTTTPHQAELEDGYAAWMGY